MNIKLFSALALGTLMLTSCSDDSDQGKTNTVGGILVNMEKATYSTRENASIFNVPISVEGTTNGSLIVYVETSPTTGEEPAVADENYIVTSQRIIIPAGETTGNVEICPVDNADENDSRFFNVTIVKVDGASIGANPTTVVELRDNDQDPYEKMTGKWIMSGYSLFTNGEDGPFTINMQTPDPDEEAEYYGNELYGFGLKNYDFIYMPFNFAYNEITDEITMSIQVGSFATTSTINFGFTGVVVGCSTTQTGMVFGNDIPLQLTYDEAGKNVIKMTPDPSAMFLLKVFQYPAMTYAGWWDGWEEMSFERAQ